MRLFKVSLALWYEPSWFSFFRRSWKRRGYWFVLRPMQVTLGPTRIDFKLEGLIKTEV